MGAGEGGGGEELEVGAKGGRKNWRRRGLTLHKKLAVQLLDTRRSVKKNVRMRLFHKNSWKVLEIFLTKNKQATPWTCVYNS